VRAAAAAALCLACDPPGAAAQAWAPPAGTGSVSVVVETIENTGHLLTDGSLLPEGKSRTAGVYVEADLAVTDRLSVTAGVPYVFAKYLGPGPAVGDRVVDRCVCWQHDWQDIGASARFTLVNRAFALTPTVAIGLPTHAYAYQGEAVVGRGLREVRVGLNAGQRLDPISPGLAVSARYEYAIVERVLDIPNNRSNAALDVAYGSSRRWSARAFGLWQRTHGGLRAGTGPPPPIAPLPWGEIATAELFDEHDRLLRDNYFRAGAGASYSWNAIEIFGSYIGYVHGTDSHAGHVIAAGVSIPFELARLTD
jgi:hypothetical protein